MENGNYWSETPDRTGSAIAGQGSDRSDPAAIGRYRVIRRLGQGGFGRVYLARDDDLDRSVAIKVPNPGRISGPVDVETYLAEARALARLDHPHIVPVFDVGRTADGHCFVVSKYIDGSDLADRIARGRPTPREAAELVATVAEALHHAHTRGLVHRDVKPANILIDAAQSPWVADFGLALKDEDYGKGARLAGTPAYMSPEQARGEGHRVDGRSDLFSLGVVLYELLTGRKPFRGEDRAEVMDQIAHAEPRPPRQIDDGLPRELERICLKALAKRASERYSTGRDLAEDLRHFVRTELATAPPAAPAPPAPPPSTVGPTPLASTPEMSPTPAVRVASDSDGRAVKIVPKGLRSFDRHDASFFLELLPGPRDRDGLPEGIRFWKMRIESTDPDATFKVGLIYGPSGCGKSSMVKAGLLPRLNKDVLPVYVEATPEETEARLLRGLRKACAELDSGLDLVEAIAAIRRGRVLRPGEKVLIVLDQFEQWLFAHRTEADPELVAALRQCDGDHVQALVMVRDDFWMAATRFMRDLEVRIVEGENSAAVDLFDPMHARRVLAAFGRAYGVLPEKPSELSTDQEAFLEQSVAGLAIEGKVISVRLALFAEMVKGKPWTTATLRAVGGARGIGVTFLDETFGAATAPPEHRLHQRAAQAVLKALLPGTGADIKGQMRSEAELRAAAGYAARPRDFEDLIVILDHELRLITPTDPEGSVDDSQSGDGGGRRFYQLTHDYLVPSLREWLTRKQRETRRGRAELRLAERAAIWESRPESRHLPSLLEWLRIRALTRPKDWTEPQRKMMRRAGRAHGLHAIAIAIGVIGLAFAGLEVWNRVAADRFIRRLYIADTGQVPAMVRDTARYRRWIEPELRQIVAEPSGNPKVKLHASLALLPSDPTQLPYLEARLLNATPGEVPVLGEAMRSRQATLTPKLWSALEAARPGDPTLLTAAGILALYDPEGPRWGALGEKVAQALVRVNPAQFGPWLEVMRPALARLTAPLAAIVRDRTRPETEHALAASILADSAHDDPAMLAGLLLDSDPISYASLFPALEKQADRASPILREELHREAARPERPLDPSWPKPDAAPTRAIESSEGRIEDRSAFCQTMPLADAMRLVADLQRSGYRPLRFRPYADGRAVKVAAVWTRDGRKARVASDLSPEAIVREDEENRRERLIPVDVAGYLGTDDGKPVERYAAVWVEREAGEDAQMYVGKSAEDEPGIHDGLNNLGLAPRTLQILHRPDGSRSISGVWGALSSGAIAAETSRDLFEESFAAIRTRREDAVLLDASVGEASRPRPFRERARTDLDSARRILEAKPGDLEARRARAMAELRLDEPAKALEDLNALIETKEDDVQGLPYRAIARARLGRKEEARADLAKLETLYLPGHFKQSIAAVVAAELGENADPALAALEAAVARGRQDDGLRFDAARAFAMASRPIAARDPREGRRLVSLAIRLLKDGDVELGRVDDEPAFDPIRDEPAFVELMNAGHPDRRYAAVWTTELDVDCAVIPGRDPADHLRDARGLIADGYHPVAWTAARATREGPVVTASVWHRPRVPEAEKDRLAGRQARAAVALIRMDRWEEVWESLRHSLDPRLRSSIVNGVRPLGADPGAIAEAFGRVDHPDRPGTTEAILFDRDASIRRALILALGTYDEGDLPAGDRERLIPRLIALYRDDPDPGVHGAAEWALRRWERRREIDAADADLKRHRDPDGRRWYRNGEGQTFAVIDGPDRFSMGSTAADTERNGSIEVPRPIVIPRRFAVATKEVTVEQFQRFLKSHSQFDSTPRGTLKKYSPRPDGPWIVATWYAAAAYCNWLSAQEGLPEGQWCYRPGADGLYAEGMTIPAGALDRPGYRLPTEAEWEYVCRAGAVTSRYHGTSIELLPRYAWFKSNSEGRARPCGSLLPNDLGLFDMLGNVYEWCQDRDAAYRPSRRRLSLDVATIDEVVVDKQRRMFRGGTFTGSPDELRSSAREADTPTLEYYLMGFRLARTLELRR